MGKLLDEDTVIKVFEHWKEALKENSHHVSASDLSLVIKDVRELPPAQPEPTDINAKEAVYNLAEKIGIHQLFALTVELRGEPIQPEPQWIPVGEKLPETEDFVLASLSGKYRNITFEHACEIADYADGEWCIYAYPNMSAEKCAELIEAWMPLPEAYKPNK